MQQLKIGEIEELKKYFQYNTYSLVPKKFRKIFSEFYVLHPDLDEDFIEVENNFAVIRGIKGIGKSFTLERYIQNAEASEYKAFRFEYSNIIAMFDELCLYNQLLDKYNSSHWKYVISYYILSKHNPDKLFDIVHKRSSDIKYTIDGGIEGGGNVWIAKVKSSGSAKKETQYIINKDITITEITNAIIKELENVCFTIDDIYGTNETDENKIVSLIEGVYMLVNNSNISSRLSITDTINSVVDYKFSMHYISVINIISLDVRHKYVQHILERRFLQYLYNTYNIKLNVDDTVCFNGTIKDFALRMPNKHFIHHIISTNTKEKMTISKDNDWVDLRFSKSYHLFRYRLHYVKDCEGRYAYNNELYIEKDGIQTKYSNIDNVPNITFNIPLLSLIVKNNIVFNRGYIAGYTEKDISFVHYVNRLCLFNPRFSTMFVEKCLVQCKYKYETNFKNQEHNIFVDDTVFYQAYIKMSRIITKDFLQINATLKDYIELFRNSTQSYFDTHELLKKISDISILYKLFITQFIISYIEDSNGELQKIQHPLQEEQFNPFNSISEDSISFQKRHHNTIWQINHIFLFALNIRNN